MIRFLTVAVALLAAFGISSAGGYYRSSCYQPTYERQVVVEKQYVVEPVYALSYLQVPLYQYSYEPVKYSSSFTSSYAVATQARAYQIPAYTAPLTFAPAYQATMPVAQTCEQKYEALAQKVQQMEQMMSNGGGNPQRLASRATGGVFTNRCASCHSETTAATKGDNLILLRNGQPDNWTADIRERIYDQITTQSMPKGSKLSAEELSEAVTYLREIRKTASSQRSTAPAASQQPQLEEYPAEPTAPAKP